MTCTCIKFELTLKITRLGGASMGDWKLGGILGSRVLAWSATPSAAHPSVFPDASQRYDRIADLPATLELDLQRTTWLMNAENEAREMAELRGCLITTGRYPYGLCSYEVGVQEEGKYINPGRCASPHHTWFYTLCPEVSFCFLSTITIYFVLCINMYSYYVHTRCT